MISMRYETEGCIQQRQPKTALASQRVLDKCTQVKISAKAELQTIYTDGQSEQSFDCMLQTVNVVLMYATSRNGWKIEKKRKVSEFILPNWKDAPNSAWNPLVLKQNPTDDLLMPRTIDKKMSFQSCSHVKINVDTISFYPFSRFKTTRTSQLIFFLKLARHATNM